MPHELPCLCVVRLHVLNEAVVLVFVYTGSACGRLVALFMAGFKAVCAIIASIVPFASAFTNMSAVWHKSDVWLVSGYCVSVKYQDTISLVSGYYVSVKYQDTIRLVSGYCVSVKYKDTIRILSN